MEQEHFERQSIDLFSQNPFSVTLGCVIELSDSHCYVQLIFKGVVKLKQNEYQNKYLQVQRHWQMAVAAAAGHTDN